MPRTSSDFDAASVFSGENCLIHYPEGMEGLSFNGEAIDDLSLLRLACAMDGSTITVRFVLIDAWVDDDYQQVSAIELRTDNTVFLDRPIVRNIYRATTGEIVIGIISNDDFVLNSLWQRKGIGTFALALQVRQALALGIKKLVAMVAGSKGSRYSGYIVWPQLGYDGLIPADIWKNSLPATILEEMGFDPNVPEYLSELLRREGLDLWADHGAGYMMHFDVDEGRPEVRRLLDLIERSGL